MKNRIGSWNEVDVYRVSKFDDVIAYDEAIYVFDDTMYYKCHRVGYLRGTTVQNFDYDLFERLRHRQPPAAPIPRKKEETSSTSGKSEEDEILRVPSAEELDKFFNSISVKLEDYICSGQE